MSSLPISLICGISIAATLATAPAWSDSASQAVTAKPSQETRLEGVSEKLEKQISDKVLRQKFLQGISSEAKRAGISPFLVLSIIDVASGFRKYSVSHDGARGYMQVMPHWVKVIGKPEHNLFHMNTNLRYGCTLMKNYIDEENGDLKRALVKYRVANSGPQSHQADADAFADAVLKKLNSWQ
jgi:soluble lytic murein transglycosylase-like protein